MDVAVEMPLVEEIGYLDVAEVEPSELRKFTPEWAYLPLVDEEDAVSV